MNSTEVATLDTDAELARRLARLSTRRPAPRQPTEPQSGDDELAARLHRLTQARCQPSTGSHAAAPSTGRTRGKRKRRHAARRSRLGALLLSLAATGGLAAQFAATDGATNSIVSAPGSVVAPTVVNGDVYTNRFGPVQVQATFASDGSLTAIDAVQTPDADRKSVRINDRAVPTLNSEALNAQSANVDTVSGATYTSLGYEQSLQSAIDTARASGLTDIA